jgi:radical SAM-linked protein
VRIRLRYAKLGKVRFLGHRDLARVWERSWRKARLPITYTEGFNPRPKMHFGLALSTGYESIGEYLDVDVPDGADLVVDDLPDRLSPLLPEGVDLQVAAAIAPGTTSLQEAVTSCGWRFDVVSTEGALVADQLTDAVAALLAADIVEITRERKGKATTDDIRSYIRTLSVLGPGHRGIGLTAELGTQPRGLRPAELLIALAHHVRPAATFTAASVLRTHQWTSPDGARQEPLELPATWAAHAEVRAS